MTDIVLKPAMRALSVEEVLEITGISRPTFYEHAFAGRIKARKLGRRTVVLESDLREYLESLPTLEGQQGKGSYGNAAKREAIDAA
jgi:excisionase family DNA binding protein